MAEPAQPCTCTPYQNFCCCGPEKGISVVQPSCQNLPDGSVVNNPAFVPELGKSFWTYKFITDCASGTKAVSNLGIPVCEVLTTEHITVSEKIDGCGTFTPVPFTVTKSDPNLGTAPEGFRFVKVETQNRFEKGVSVEYRLEIVGDFPIDIQPVKVKAETNILTFDCDCFQVPKCAPQGKLVISKQCGHQIVNNQATLNYNLTVDNIGKAPLSNVQFQDTVFIPTQLTFGTVTVSPPTLTVNTATPGQIKISGNLGAINPGGEVLITYTIPVTGISGPGKYIISNTARVSATGTEATASCSTNLDAAQVSSAKCCRVSDGNQGRFTMTISAVGTSPEVRVNVFDNLTVPGGVTVQFNSFGGCSATFANTGEPVPTNTNISGPVRIRIDCNNLLVPSGGSVQKTITFTVVSSTVFGTATIANAIETITPTDPGAQVFLGAGTLPVEADIAVELKATCLQPCT